MDNEKEAVADKTWVSYGLCEHVNVYDPKLDDQIQAAGKTVGLKMDKEKFDEFIYELASFMYVSNASLNKDGITLRQIIGMPRNWTVEQYQQGIIKFLAQKKYLTNQNN